MSELTQRIEDKTFALIAEVGVNYYDIARQRGLTNIEAAKLMCLEAQKAGATAVKFQSYKAESLASRHSPSYWDTSEESTRSQYLLFKKYDSFGEAEYAEISRYCREIEIDFCSTAFDFESADYLCSLMDVYKVSSSDLTNLPFIEYQAAKGKPMIISVGAGNLDEIKQAVEIVRKVNTQPLVLMHCVLEYPTPYGDAHLRRIASLCQEFPDLVIGYSDHCRPDESADVIKTAYTLGARIIEKHFTLDKNLPGNDHYHAMDPLDIENIVSGVSFVEILLGKGDLDSLDEESMARLNARRSIVAKENIQEGTVIDRSMLAFKRPGTGISPAKIDEVVGCRARRSILEDEIILKDMLQ